jgi:DHA1 family multidrug resistance protein-like MFS transporter
MLVRKGNKVAELQSGKVVEGGSAPAKRSGRRRILILAFALVVVMLGFGLVIPIFPFYIEALGASGRELGLLVATSALLEFVFSPLWGSVSDRTGRKPVLMVGLLGYGISALLFGLATQLWMLFAARALSGLLSSATLAASMAYVGDTTSEEDRGSGMGILGAAMALGLILGPAMGGALAGDSLSRPFFIAAAMSLVALLLVLFLLPETRECGMWNAECGIYSARRTPHIALPLGGFKEALIGPLGVLLFMVALFSFALSNFEAVFGLYALEKFDYGPEKVGIILMVVALVSTVGKASLTGPTTRRWGEERVIRASLIAGSVGFATLILADTFVTILLATAFFILSKTLLRPAALALISKRATEGQGAVMGLSNSFSSLGRIAGPIWAGFVFDWHVDLPYLSGAVFMFIGFVLSLIWIKPHAETAVRQAELPLADTTTPHPQ